MPSVRTLLIDNYDSYTYNLYQLLSEVNGAAPEVLRNDEVDWETLLSRFTNNEFDNVVISPGPGSPDRNADVGLCRLVFQELTQLPVLGICLGLQVLATVHGATVSHAPYPVHGRLSAVHHQGKGLFRGIPSGDSFAVVRYHSLAVEADTLPVCLEVTAWASGILPSQPSNSAAGNGSHSHYQPSASQTSSHDASDWPKNVCVRDACCCDSVPLPLAIGSRAQGNSQTDQQPNGTGLHRLHASKAKEQDDTRANNETYRDDRGNRQCKCDASQVIMGLKHKERPHVAVQFHPESVATAYGAAIIQNFTDLTLQFLEMPPAPHRLLSLRGPPGACKPAAQWETTRTPPVEVANEGEASTQPSPVSAPLQVMWKRLRGLLPACGGSASIFTALHGNSPSDNTFWLDSAATERARFSFCGGKGGPLWRQLSFFLGGTDGSSTAGAGVLHIQDGCGIRTLQTDSFWDFLSAELAARSCHISPEAAAALPFDFWGGFVGYLGYGLNSGDAHHSSDPATDPPDAALFLADRLVAMDHANGDLYMVALSEASAAAVSKADQWLVTTAGQLQQLVTTQPVNDGQPCTAATSLTATSSNDRTREGLVAHHTRQQYIHNVEECLQALHDGESYELCLTTSFTGQAQRSAWESYKILRSINPAPYGAWLSFGGDGPQVCCSSPERFLRGGRGRTLEAQPIKGTCRRSADPEEDARLAAALLASDKDRAENLMIVDLLRNDLGRTCEPGSVHVPSLMAVQSFATVHQLVSTARGLRRSDKTLVDSIKAAFPGGSMTGAPKLRSMQILDRLEGKQRGVYSGCIGFIGFNDTFDLNIVIRSAVFYRGGVTVGAGGAITVASDPVDEYEEMLLKAAPVLQAVGPVCASNVFNGFTRD